MSHLQALRTVAAVALIAALSATGAAALAQNTPGTPLVVVLRDGTQIRLLAFGWKGISATAVFGMAQSYDKTKVAMVCSGQCPEKLPKATIREDVVAWRSGEPTVGTVAGVVCDDLDRCAIRQGDRRRDWSDVAYVQFAPT